LSEESRTRLNYPEDQPLTFGFLETPCPELGADISAIHRKRCLKNANVQAMAGLGPTHGCSLAGGRPIPIHSGASSK
jgi:hypothetical protein